MQYPYLGWIRAIDEAMVASHIGIAGHFDTYEEAKRKLNLLLCYHQDIATDPAVNGGWKLMPPTPTPEMRDMLRQGSLKDMPSDELCNVRYAALRAKAPPYPLENHDEATHHRHVQSDGLGTQNPGCSDRPQHHSAAQQPS